MCGFVGFTNKINDANQVIENMMEAIRHRGPDAGGKYVDEDIALGHRRLSIIDVSEQGNQLSTARTVILCWSLTAKSITIKKSEKN